MHKSVRYWGHIEPTAMIDSDQLPRTIKIHGKSKYTILWKHSGAFRTTKRLISLIRSRPFCNRTFWLARSGQLSPDLKLNNWPIQVHCLIPLDQFKNFSRTYPSLKQSYWPVWVDSPIFLYQVENFSKSNWFDWTVPSWLSHILKMNWELLSILRNLIGPNYWISCTPLKCLHWLIVEELSPTWAIWLDILGQLPYLMESDWENFHFRAISLVQFSWEVVSSLSTSIGPQFRNFH